MSLLPITPAAAQINATTSALLANRYPIVTGDLTQFARGATLQGFVTAIVADQLVISVQGKTLTLQAPASALQPGTQVSVRIEEGLAIVRPETPTPSSQPTVPLGQTQIERVEILSQLPDGKYLVRLGLQESQAQAETPLPVGSKVVAQVQATPSGDLRLRPVPDSPQKAEMVAQSVLRDTFSRPSLGEVFKTLSELRQNFPESPSLQRIANTFLSEGPPSAQQLQNLVRHGGIHYELKMAQALTRPLTADEPKGIVASDLKGLVQKAQQEVSSIAKANLNTQANNPKGDPPAVQQALNHLRTAVEHIEGQQALNFLTLNRGGEVRLEIPMFNGQSWTTVQVAIVPEPIQNPTATGDSEASEKNETSRPRGYGVMMHGEFSEFGETWIDARWYGKAFYATLYIENDEARLDARLQVPQLAGQLRQEGISEVIIDIRNTVDLPVRNKEHRHAVESRAPLGVSLLNLIA